MLASGRWIAENPGALYRSYHINGIYTPNGLGRSWVQLAQEWIEAQGDAKKLVIFINTRLAESWADRSHDLKPNALIARACSAGKRAPICSTTASTFAFA